MARERVQTGSVASWIEPTCYDKDFRPKIRGEITYLLHDVQINAELGQTYVHTAMRLESQRAVQAQSQWRIGIEPQAQSIVLHSIKIRRGEVETEHASLERMQFLQREAGLERFSLLGSITLLLLLEDVCPGDILEFSYTVSNKPRVMPEYLTAFFSLPMATEIGKYRFLVRHAERRPLKWKASSPKFVPKISTDNGEVCCYWMDVGFVSPEPEGCVPVWHLMFPWIQVSDCPDWQTVARAFLAEWEKQLPGEGVSKMVEDINGFSSDPLARVNRAIELVQDGFRYLSVNLEFGGGIPAAPETVVRRRYGDCKDLAFLLVHLLRDLGVQARPVLVDTFLQKSVAAILPSPQMFNHAIVEYEIGDEKRWVDCTVKNQGGGALNRWITDFGVGLPIDAATTKLAPVPKGSLKAGTYDLKESYILDTSGKPSYLATFITATGAAADAFRHEFANAGVDVIAKDRLQGCANRFTRATRVEPLRIRDDRDANEFVLAEAFEIQNTLLEHMPSRTCLFPIRSDFTAGLMTGPGLAARQHPFALPYPCNRTHTVEIEFAGLNQITVPLAQIGNQYLTFNRRCRCWSNFLKLTFSLETLADSIPIDKQAEHRKSVEAIHEAATVNLQLPKGYSRSRKPTGFGALPPPSPSRADVSGSTVVVTEKPAAPNPPPDVPASTVVPESGAAQKLAENAGLAGPKPMPPAVDSTQFQSTPETAPTSHRHSRQKKMEKRCLYSFLIFLSSLAGNLIAIFLGRTDGTAALAGLIALLVIPSLIWSLILAGLGLRQRAKYPGRYLDNKWMAIVTLLFGGMFALFMIRPLLFGARSVMAGASARRQSAQVENGPFNFTNRVFILHPPPLPWKQARARNIGSGGVVGFSRPEPMFFTFYAGTLEPGDLNPRQHIVDLTKADLVRHSTSHEFLQEMEVTYQNLTGWRIESRATINGQDCYIVQWLLATNGFGYEFRTWGPEILKSGVKEQANGFPLNFELPTLHN